MLPDPGCWTIIPILLVADEKGKLSRMMYCSITFFSNSSQIEFSFRCVSVIPYIPAYFTNAISSGEDAWNVISESPFTGVTM